LSIVRSAVAVVVPTVWKKILLRSMGENINEGAEHWIFSTSEDSARNFDEFYQQNLDF
jgi:hypothetical protein